MMGWGQDVLPALRSYSASPLPVTSSPLALHTTPSLMFFFRLLLFFFFFAVDHWASDVQKYLARVVQKVDSAIHRIKIYPVNNAIIGFPNTYLLNSDLSGG